MTSNPSQSPRLFENHFPNKFPVPHPMPAVSLREREIIQGLSNDLTAKMIAASLCISVFTVQEHIKNIKQKLKVHTCGGIVARAFREGLVR